MNFCVAWSGIHIPRAPWFFGWIFQCPQCVHLWCMCVDTLVIKILRGVQIHYHHGIQWWWNPYIGTWSLICLYQILSHILLCCCMLVLTWNRFSLIFCVGKGFHLQRMNIVLFTPCGGVCKLEEVRVSFGLYYDSLASFYWPCLLWWVSVVRRCLLLDLFHIWWLVNFLFGFSQRPLLVLFLWSSYELLEYSFCVLSFDFKYMEVWLVNIYYVCKSIIGNLVGSSVIFRAISVIIIYAPVELFELDSGSIFDIYIW